MCSLHRRAATTRERASEWEGRPEAHDRAKRGVWTQDLTL